MLQITEVDEPGACCNVSEAVGARPERQLHAPHRARVIQDLYFHHHQSLCGYLRSKLNSADEAEDIAQEAYLRLLQMDGTKHVDLLHAYLFRIATNLVVDRARRKHVRTLHQLTHWADPYPVAPQPEGVAMAGQALQIAQTTIHGMSTKRRRAFERNVLLGRSAGQVAAEMDVSVKMIEKHVSLARAECRLALAATEPDALCQQERSRVKSEGTHGAHDVR